MRARAIPRFTFHTVCAGSSAKLSWLQGDGGDVSDVDCSTIKSLPIFEVYPDASARTKTADDDAVAVTGAEPSSAEFSCLDDRPDLRLPPTGAIAACLGSTFVRTENVRDAALVSALSVPTMSAADFYRTCVVSRVVDLPSDVAVDAVVKVGRTAFDASLPGSPPPSPPVWLCAAPARPPTSRRPP